MYIKNLYQLKKHVMSFDISSPKKDVTNEILTRSIEKMNASNPAFMSVSSLKIASHIKNSLCIEPLAHLRTIDAKKSDIKIILDEMKSQNIENILALRGDLAIGAVSNSDFKHASDLIQFIKEYGGFSIAAACYPEGHIECDDFCDNYRHLYEKQACGADFFISQLFFENGKFFRFLEMSQSKNISKPIVAGIMPIISKSQVEQMIYKCGVSLPAGIVKILYKYEHKPLDLQKAGIEYTLAQIEDLVKNGQTFIHIYSMNKPEITSSCKQFFDSLS